MNDAERIILVRWSPALAMGVLAGTAVLWVVPLSYLLSGSYAGAELVLRWLGVAALAVPFGWVAWRAPKAVRGMGLMIDAAGIHPFDGRTVETIGWHEIAGVGFGSYTGNYRGLQTRTMAALEIYLTDAEKTTGHPRLRNDWQQVATPAPGLSAGCFRFTVSPYGDAGARIESAVRRHRAHLWVGPFTHG
ncbi:MULTISPECIES: hypothetical protein [Mycolicibacterium]|uniref:Uncharacterized protein n=1 Tax=Mycolicibacterium neoaurum TaxID=1795 RepID=A0AAV2WM14_MYCNE|nr:hypothetical protein [Mycolicibacterium neoaurum]CDQ45147.1 hypothetical protein BN1047_03035 [Mycolicibacterium neoaurum]SDC35027.1 hypothetical protein SAMN04488581_0605 [Mycolicibacterium neoaurum]